jgi:prepilin signal peptidase PulO-like enzyme (type II secretory pathway)
MTLKKIATAIDSTSLSTSLKSIEWIVPLVQCVHIVMIGVVFVSILMISLRVLGLVRVDEPLPRVWRRFAPFLWSGLAVMVLTGMLLVIAEPVRQFMTLSFRLKMLLLTICVSSAAAFARSVRGATRAESLVTGTELPSPIGLRLAAVATLALWLSIIFLGRAIAYDDSVWGDWSPMESLGGAST